MLYFAYASNLSKKYMASRCPNALPLKKVILKNYKLTFNELADIVPFEGEDVVGALYLISKQELEKLDALEGYPDLYDRMVVELEDEFGNKYEALAYTMVEKSLQPPPDSYYKILVEGYSDWGIELERLEKAKNME
jgi:gamma-glutamylcyclotransferase (GGCT)/AIG2-like uncharacterized protein YtfP